MNLSPQVSLDGLPVGRVLIRVIGLDSDGAVIGFRDFTVALVAGTNPPISVEALISGTPPSPALAAPDDTSLRALAFLAQPTSTELGASQSVSVLAIDAQGFRATGAQGQAALSVSQDTSPVNGTLQAQFVSGVATFSVSLGQTGTHRLLAGSQGLETLSDPFDVLAPPPPPTPVPSSLRFLTFPIQGVEQQPFNPLIAVEVLDQFGQVITQPPVTVTIRLADDPPPQPGAFLRGQTSRETVDGQTGFIGVDIAGVGQYRIVANAPGLPPITSSILTISPAPMVRPNGRIYVASRDNASLRVFPWGLATGSLFDGDLAPISTLSGGSTQLTGVQGLARSGDRLWVVHDVANRVSRFEGVSALNGDVAPAQTFQLNGAIDLFDVEYDAANDRLFFSDTAAGSVHVVDNATTRTGAFTADRTITAFTGVPEGLQYDAANDRLYVARFSVGGTLGIQFFNSASTANGDANTIAAGTIPGFAPRFMFLDSANQRMFVSDGPAGPDRIRILGNLNTTPTTTALIEGANPNFGLNLNGIYYDAGRDEVWVADQNNDRIKVFTNVNGLTGSQDIAPTRTLGGANSGLSDPHDITADPTR